MREGDLLRMSGKELTRLEVVQRLVEGGMKQREAAGRLGVSVRQIKRLVRAFRRQGAAGLVSQRRGQPSNRRIPEAEQAHFITLVNQHYQDFGPTLAAEYLTRCHGFTRSVETLRGWMIEAEIWTAKRARRRRPHPPRERRPRLGELIQIDGSPHAWFEERGPRCCLIGFIDDSTSQVMGGRFVPQESTRAYLRVLHDYVLAYGVPAACYSDRHAIFRKTRHDDLVPTQVERAMRELGIEPIHARSPQAKGRIERLFGTLQDRLVKALRLAGISDMAPANAFLNDYLVEHNERFAKAPQAPGNAHQPWRRVPASLARICALHHERKVTPNLVISFANQLYRLEPSSKRRYSTLRGSRVQVYQHLDGAIEILHNGRSIPYALIESARRRPALADEKDLNDQVDKLLGPHRSSTYKPPSSHPWRQRILPPRPAQLGGP